MKLILAHYLRTLRERDEFDRLLPELLLAMGYAPLSKPQAGTRQFGVDFSAVGKSPKDGLDELLLFVIKQGDIGRNEWDGVPTAIRPTLNEVIDIYLTRHVPQEYSTFRKVIILTTTGGLKQEAELNWVAFRDKNIGICTFDFWGGDVIALFIEKYMLDEHVFAQQDRVDLRKSLALAGDIDYNFKDFTRLILRQLGINSDGSILDPQISIKMLNKRLRRGHLATQICAHWAESEGNFRQALWICERGLLWAWHRVLGLCDKDLGKVYPAIIDLLRSYFLISQNYYKTIVNHFYVQDGMSGYSQEGAVVALVLFEHIGLVATMGLFALFFSKNEQQDAQEFKRISVVIADGLNNLIINNRTCSSPRLDVHIVDIALALLFLKSMELDVECREWLSEISIRLDYSFKSCGKFPVDTDSIDDLIILETNIEDADQRKEYMQTSWCLATVASWCVLLGLDDHYKMLETGHRNRYSQVCAQLWHTNSDWQNHWYFSQARDFGETEAPYELPQEPEELRKRIAEFLNIPCYQWGLSSRSRQFGLSILDFIACRHFRRPIPAFAWYRLFIKPDSPEKNGVHAVNDS